MRNNSDYEVGYKKPPQHTRFKKGHSGNSVGGPKRHYSLKEAQIVIEQWRKHYNTIRPHSALNYRPPAPQTFAPTTNHLDEILPMQ